MVELENDKHQIARDTVTESVSTIEKRSKPSEKEGDSQVAKVTRETEESVGKILKKRFIIRTDPSVRLAEEQTRQAVVRLLPKDVLVSAVFCDDATGEVVLEVSKPEAIDPNTIVQIAQTTGWIAHTRRSPHIPSSSINIIHSTLKGSAKDRTDFLQKLGKRVFRGSLIVGNNNGNGTAHQQISAACEGQSGTPTWSTNREEVMLFCLGGVKQV